MIEGVNIRKWTSFRMTNLSIVMILIVGSYLSWNTYGAPGPEVLIFFHAGLQWLIWRLAKKGKLTLAFAIPFIWFILEVTMNGALLLATYATDDDLVITEQIAADFPYESTARAIGFGFAVMMFAGHLWMALDIRKFASKQ